MKHRFAGLYGLAFLAAGCTCVATGAMASPPTTTAEAAPPHHVSVHHHRRHAATKLPPLANAAPASPAPPASSPAPVPNEAVNAPIDDNTRETSVAPSVFQLHYPPQGDGYTTGSSSQAMDDREAAKATGVQMKVPLPQ